MVRSETRFLTRVARHLMATLALGLAACGTDDGATSETGCVDGMRQACTCPDGRGGATTCRQGAFEECVCVGAVADASGLPEPNGGASDTGDIESDAPVEPEETGLDAADGSAIAPDTADDTDADAINPELAADADDVADVLDEPDAPEPTDVADVVAPEDTVTPPDVADVADVVDVLDVMDVLDVVDVRDVVDVADVADVRDVVDVADVADVRDVVDVVDVLDVVDTTDTVVDPCGGIPAEGRCRDASTVERCVVSSGTGLRVVRRIGCASGQACSVASGTAECVSTAVCTEGATRCGTSTRLETCTGNRWVASTCSIACDAITGGAQCRAAGGRRTLTSRVRYELRTANSGFTDWNAGATTAYGGGMLVLSYDNGVQIDSAVTSLGDDIGTFSIDVPAVTDSNDILLVLPVSLNAASEIRFGIARPTTTGDVDVESFLNAPSSFGTAFWQWSFNVSAVGTSPEITLPIASGSGAALAFRWLVYSYEVVEAATGNTVEPSVIMWWNPATEWSCGACAVDFPGDSLGYTFDHQVFLSGGPDEGIWSIPVTVHEFGHVVMSAYGRSPNEGGLHYIGVPSHPGLAWSEGWATGFSARMRANTRYYDKQGGGMFWFDISSRRYPSGLAWNRARSADGLLQLIDENEIAAMLWSIMSAIGTNPTLQTLRSRRMTVAPFLRGYTTRYWENLNADLLPLPYTDTRQSAPYFADYADAVVCAGLMTATAMDAVTVPATFYPYRGSTALCR